MAKLLRLPQVLDAVEISKTILYRLLDKGALPALLRPSWSRIIAWRDADIEEWIESRATKKAA